MTVKELIDLLSKFDENIVVTYYNEYTLSPEALEVSVKFCNIRQRLELELS